MWTPKQLQQLQQGGNDKLDSFLDLYDLKQEMDFKLRYATKAVGYYRRKN
jgi:hypothetical protein